MPSPFIEAIRSDIRLRRLCTENRENLLIPDREFHIFQRKAPSIVIGPLRNHCISDVSRCGAQGGYQYSEGRLERDRLPLPQVSQD